MSSGGSAVPNRPSRREFSKNLAAGSVAALAKPAISSAGKANAAALVLGNGDYQFRANHQWAQLPDRYTWQTTHNIAVDSNGLVYIIHEGRDDQPNHPAIFVFDSEGRFVRAFGSQFQGGGHGLDIRREGGDEFLYVTAYHKLRSFAKFTLTGETVWHRHAPMESGRYADGEDRQPREDNPWGRDRFLPTNFAFHPDGGFYLADGYGGYCIHRYDAEGNWLGQFGGPSDESDAEGSFDTPHGIWIDDRGDEPLVVVADRANARLQWFTLDGDHRGTQGGFLLPANVDVRGELMLVPDLVGRVTLLNRENQVLAQLGDDSVRIAADDQRAIRRDESQWRPGKFVHPHDAAFDKDGNIFVVEWVATGRVTLLKKV